jgi:hypothetical protein
MSERRRHPLLTLLFWQAVGFALLFTHFGLVVLLGNAVTALMVTVTLVAMLYWVDSLAGFAVFLVFVLYQNLAISTICEWLSPELYHASLATGFAVTLALAGVAGCRLWSLERNRAVLLSLGLAGLIIVFYTVVGAMKSSFGSAAVYFRGDSVALTGLLIGWDVGRNNRYRLVGLCYLVAITPGLGAAVLEITTPILYYDWINAPRYYFLHASDATSFLTRDFARAQDVVDSMTANFFNLSLGSSHTVRFGGPNMHSVSYAYVLSIGAVVAISMGAYWYALAIVPLLFLGGVKGGVILLASTIGLSFIGRYFGTRILTLSGVSLGTVYVAFAIWYGMSIGDYHVIGLLGGLNGFLDNPLGRGLGVGGNLSVEVASIDLRSQWDLNQRFGSDVALESAIGVLLYQMGIGSLAVAYGIWIAFVSCIHHLRRGTNMVPLAIAVLAVNGLFQEEAISPYSMGLLTMFAAALSADVPFKRTEGLHVGGPPPRIIANSDYPVQQHG